jgi:pyrroline-5-carboxylate reductase
VKDVTRHHDTLAVIGGGRMGEAIIGGLIAANAMDAAQITVAEPSELRRADLAADYGVCGVASATEALPAQIVILAVKPQVIDSVVDEIAGQLTGSLAVSIAAGVSCLRLEARMPEGVAVVRVMPNTPALVGAGMAVVSGGSEATAEQVELVRSLFEHLGEALVLDERFQDAATAISGSGPAYFALVIDALARAGVMQGLTREIAQTLAVQTMRGTAHLIDEGDLHPEALIDGVASPGGTTIAAIEVLEARAVRSAFADAVAAGVRRAKELGS